MIIVRILTAGEAGVLDRVAEDVFDHAVCPNLAQEFVSDPRHHLAVAITEDGEVIGMASGVHYVHPDKQPQMFINEVGVSPAHEGQGIGRRLLECLLERAKELGCSEAWTATEPDNVRANGLYARVGGIKDPTPFVMYTFAIPSDPDPING